METPIPLYILAGGQSSRFGSDKALADAGGTPLICRVAEQWRPWTSSVTVVADRPDKYAALGLRTIADQQPALGPLGGLATALQDSLPGWLALAACDGLLLDPSAPQHLLAQRSDDVHVVAFRTARWEPLPALYHTALLPTVQAALARGEGALWRLIERVPHRALACSPALVAQINTVEDLRRYVEHIEKPTQPPA